jgi:hypothetical protein
VPIVTVQSEQYKGNKKETKKGKQKRERVVDREQKEGAHT